MHEASSLLRDSPTECKGGAEQGREEHARPQGRTGEDKARCGCSCGCVISKRDEKRRKEGRRSINRQWGKEIVSKPYELAGKIREYVDG